MGLPIDRDTFDDDDRRRFAKRLGDSLEVLRELLDDPSFGLGPTTLGAEVELSIVDRSCRALPVNRRLLAESLDDQLALELDRFNIEYNLSPVPARGTPFSAQADELTAALERLDRSAAVHGGRVVPIGILPTLRIEDLTSSSMTDLPRYRALSSALRELRGDPFRICIDGDEPLEVFCDDVTAEGAATSFQVHLRVTPETFADTYNAAQMATALAVAAGANSPVFLGRRLWEETRIALFREAVDTRDEAGRKRHQPHRVGFGHGWVRRGAHELFEQAVALFPPLLPVTGDEDPLACLKSGRMPALHELRLHQGTVWLWNRPVFDPADGGHLRIELRALPSGPTPTDMMASAAFLIGLTIGLRSEIDRLLPRFPFRYAEHNFFQAARYGLDAELLWPSDTAPSPSEVGVRELASSLLTTAQSGLEQLGVDSEEIASMLGVVFGRLQTDTNGSRWQRRMLDRLEPRSSLPQALTRMTEAYVRNAKRGRPVHEWGDEAGQPGYVRREAGPIGMWDAPSGADVGASAEEMLERLGGPALLRLPGRDRSRTRAVTTLLHGNEPSGLRALHALIRSGEPPAVDLLCFVGAVDAARAAPTFTHRTLPGRPDLNRCFATGPDTPEGLLATRLLEELRRAEPEALIDLHNTSGDGPAYGVWTRRGPEQAALTALFADHAIFTEIRLGTVIEALEEDFPAISVECGGGRQPSADRVALDGLLEFARRDSVLQRREGDAEIDVLPHPVRVELVPGARLAYGTGPGAGADLTLRDDIESCNFETVRASETLGWPGPRGLDVLRLSEGVAVMRPEQFFALRDGRVVTARPLALFMATTDADIARSDCLFYVVADAEKC